MLGWQISPIDFWQMTPMDWWWIFDEKREDKAAVEAFGDEELLEMLNQAEQEKGKG